jgi:periodic tryptophan protein 2
MKFNYKFNRLCGTVFSNGNLLYTADGNSILSPVGNRISHFDLTTNESRTMDFECRADIRCVAVTSDNRLLLAVDETNHAVLVNFQRGVILHRFSFKKKVRCIEFSPDDEHFAVSYGKHLQVWQTPALRREFAPFVLHRTYTGQHDDVVSIKWSSDGAFILAASKDNTARLFSLNPTPNFEPTTLAGHRGPLVGAFFGLSDTDVYTVSADGAVFSWAWKKSPSNDEEASDFFTSAPDLAPPLVGGAWSLANRHFFNQENSSVSCVAMSSGDVSSLLVVGFDTGVFGLYDMPGCSNIHTLSVSKHHISSVAINSSGEWLSFGCPTLGQLLVWEWQSETYVLKQQGHSYAMNTMAYSPDSQYIATGGEDGKLKMWNMTSGFCFVTFSEHTAPITAVCFPNPSVVLSASLDGTVRAHDLVRYRNFKTLTTPEPRQFVSLAVDPSAEMVCAGTLDPFEIYLWSLQTGKVLDVLSGHKGPVTSLSFNPSVGTLASGSWDGTVRLWDVFKNNVVETLTHTSDVLCLDWRPDGKMLVAGTLSGSLHFWDTNEGNCVHVIDGQRDIVGGRKQNDRVAANNNAASRHFTSVCYSADGMTVLAGGNSKYVCIYEISQQMLLKKFQISHNRSLDGVLDKLNSKFMTDGGPVSEIDQNEEDIAAKGANAYALPGAKRQDDGTRKTKLEVRSSCVKFSSTGRGFSAVTTEGLLCYALDEDLIFDPIALTEDVTPSAVSKSVKSHQFGQGLAMALLLNETPLIELVVDNVPLESIDLVVRAVNREHLERLLQFLSLTMAKTNHVEYYLIWTLSLLKYHGKELEGNRNSTYLRGLRSLYKSVLTRFGDVKKVCDENHYSLAFLKDALAQHVTM